MNSKILTLGIVLFFPFAVTAQISLTGGAYQQNFNTLANAGTSSLIPSGWAFHEADDNANDLYTAGRGSSTTGDTYSFGLDGDTERAFGGLLSGTLIPTIGAQFTNNTGAIIKQFTISYTGEQWRLGAEGRGADRLDFQYSTDALSLTTGLWFDFNDLDFSTPNTIGTGAKNGNLDENKSIISANVTGLNIPDGGTFWIKWVDFNAANSDDGLAIDDFSITVNCKPVIAANIGMMLNENSMSVINNTLLNSTDADNPASELLYTIVDIPVNGSILKNGIPIGVNSTFTQQDINNNTISYAHNGSETVSDDFKFDLSDPFDAGFSGQTFTITISPINDEPYLSDINKELYEDSLLSFSSNDFINAFTDNEGDPIITVKIVSVPQNGTLELKGILVSPDQEISIIEINDLVYYPHKDFFGSDVVEWNGSDGDLYTFYNAFIYLQVNNVDDLPIISGLETEPLSFCEGDAPKIITELIYITDIDDDLLIGALVQITLNFNPDEDFLLFHSSGNISAVFDSGTGTLTLSGDANLENYQTALRSIQYLNSNAAKPDIRTREISFTILNREKSNILIRQILVTGVNDSPTIAEIGNQNIFENSTLTLPLIISDEDGDDIIVGAVSSVPQVSLIVMEGNLTLTPDSGWTGTAQISINISDSLLSDSVSFFLTVRPIMISLLQPNGGEIWKQYIPHEIIWSSEGVSKVELELTSDNGTSWVSIVDSIPSPGQYIWNPSPSMRSSECKVKITDLNNHTKSDQSDTKFRITVPFITVTRPNGEEVFRIGRTEKIEWTSQDNFIVRIELSQDGGINWHLISSSTSMRQNNFINWNVAGIPSKNSLIRISSSTETEVSDTSDMFFRINSESGDIDQNNHLSAYDASLILQFIAGVISFTDDQQEAADLDNDDIITANDTYYLLYKIVFGCYPNQTMIQQHKLTSPHLKGLY